MGVSSVQCKVQMALGRYVETTVNYPSLFQNAGKLSELYVLFAKM